MKPSHGLWTTPGAVKGITLMPTVRGAWTVGGGQSFSAPFCTAFVRIGSKTEVTAPQQQWPLSSQRADIMACAPDGGPNLWQPLHPDRWRPDPQRRSGGSGCSSRQPSGLASSLRISKRGRHAPSLHRERLSVPRDLADCSSLHHHVFGGMTRQGPLGGRSIN
jgi:hypothetical protein